MVLRPSSPINKKTVSPVYFMNGTSHTLAVPSDPFGVKDGRYELIFQNFGPIYIPVAAYRAFVAEVAASVQLQKRSEDARDIDDLRRNAFTHHDRDNLLIFRLGAWPPPDNRLMYKELQLAVALLEFFIDAWQESRFVPTATLQYAWTDPHDHARSSTVARGSLGRRYRDGSDKSIGGE